MSMMRLVRGRPKVDQSELVPKQGAQGSDLGDIDLFWHRPRPRNRCSASRRDQRSAGTTLPQATSAQDRFADRPNPRPVRPIAGQMPAAQHSGKPWRATYHIRWRAITHPSARLDEGIPSRTQEPRGATGCRQLGTSSALAPDNGEHRCFGGGKYF